MRAIYLQSHRRPDSVVVGERPDPEPGPGEIRVRVSAASFNHVDLYMPDSGAGISHELPLVLGVDGAGVVDALGPGVKVFPFEKAPAALPYLEEARQFGKLALRIAP